jgi:immune inhibitor A
MFRVTFALFLLVCTAPLPTSAHGSHLDGPQPVSADPQLLESLGTRAVARLAGDSRPEIELYALHQDAMKAGGPEKVVGTGTCLLILVDWADHPADQLAHPGADFQSMMFSTGVWPTGSMNDFYLENSQGQYGVTGAASGWHTSGTPYANVTPTDYSQVRTMLAAIITEFDPVIDYSLYDNDGPDDLPDSGDDDGYIDALFFVHAGPGRESTGDDNDIWSHAWSFTSGVPTADGVSAYRYSVEPEAFSDGTLMTVGVFCHEYGHVIGLPDLYDTDYTSSGIGDWGLMSGGSWGRAPGGVAGSSPSHLTAWCKARLGWLTPTTVTSDVYGAVLPPAEFNNVAYRIFRGGAAAGDEYFLVENRQPVGFDQTLTRRQVDFGLPQAAGMVIYHVDEAVSGNSNENHRLVDVVEASPWFDSPTDWLEHLDGPRDYALQLWLNNYNRGDNGDAWPGWSTASADSTDWVGPRDRDRFADDTIPPAHDYTCDPTGIAIENIVAAGQDVTADFLVAAKRAPMVAPDKILSWDFEADTGGWQFCNGYVHHDTSQSGSCSGAGGLWFGLDDPDWVCPPGYGNNWYDFTWKTVGVSAGATVSLRHHYGLESGYDYAWVEVRCADDPVATWYTVANFDGTSACVTDTWAIPPAAIAAYANEYGYAVLDLRLRMTSDGGWSAEDGSFCGIGWWIDEVTITGEYATAAGDPPTPARAELLPAMPNPFNPSTTLKFNVPAGAREVSLTVFDQRGRAVRALSVDNVPGWAEARWDGRDEDGRTLSSGVYFARLDIDGSVLTEKLALLK